VLLNSNQSWFFDGAAEIGYVLTLLVTGASSSHQLIFLYLSTSLNFPLNSSHSPKC